MKKELNVEDYMALKEKRYTDNAIIAFFKTTRWKFDQWKKDNHLTGYRLPPRREHKLEQKKRQYIELYNAGWSHEAIAEKMNMSPSALSYFKGDYFPELKRKSPRHFTKEELATMAERGLTRTAMIARLQKMTFEEAIKIPPREAELEFTKKQMKLIKSTGLHRNTIRHRMAKGMTFREAILTPRKTGNQHVRKGATG